MALSESSILSNDTIDTIECLLNEFDWLFPSLYSVSISIYKYGWIALVLYDLMKKLEKNKSEYEENLSRTFDRASLIVYK